MKKALIFGLTLFAFLRTSAQTPLVQASNINFDYVNHDAVLLSWTNGDGAARLVIAYTDTPVSFPSDFTTYTANNSYGSGDNIPGPDGAYVVYNGTGNQVMVNGLSAGTPYYFHVFEYNTGGPNYNISPETNNPGTTTTGSTPCAWAGSDTNVCASSSSLNASAVNGGTGTWTILNPIGGESFDDPSSSATNFYGTQGNTYFLQWSVAGGSCDGTDIVIITFDANPSLSDPGTSQQICGSSASVTANIPTVGTGMWSSAPAGTFGDVYNNATTFDGSPGTTYVITWTITNGGCSPSQNSTTIEFDSPPIANAGSQQITCSTNVTLAANDPSPGTGSWSIVSGSGGSFTDVNSYQSDFSELNGGTFMLRWTVVDGVCTPATSDVEIIFETPVASNHSFTMCSGSALNYDLQNHMNVLGNGIASDFSWVPTADPNITGHNSGSGNAISDGLANNGNSSENVVYTVSPVSTGLGCPGANFDVTITVDPLPFLDGSLDKTIDSGSPTEITLATDPLSAPAIAYNINSVTPNTLIPSGGNAVIGGGYSSNVIFNDQFTNPGSFPDVVQYAISPVGVTSCVGTQSVIAVTVNAPKVLAADSLALVDLYNATDGNNWFNKGLLWLSGNVSSWHGVTVTAGRVTALNLPSNNLVGTLPASITNLTDLTELRLDGNALSGSLPPGFDNLNFLTVLNLSGNNFSGNIPLQIGTIASLEELDLSSNSFTGGISFITSLLNLRILNLSNNDLTGSIPTSIGGLTALENLVLGNNRLSGTIPSQIGNLTSLNTYLWLGGNELSGSIPTEIQNLTGVIDMRLDHNQLTGAVPATFNNLVNLQVLNINNNRLSELPDLTSMISLVQLDVMRNDFTFEDIIPNLGITSFVYQTQNAITPGGNLTVTLGGTLNLAVPITGVGNVYQWKNSKSEVIPGATSTTFTLANANASNAGMIFLEVTNPAVPDLILNSGDYIIDVLSPLAAEESGYTFLKKIGTEALGLDDFLAGRTSVDLDGDIYVVNNSSEIRKYSPGGNLLLSLQVTGPGGRLSCISDIAVDEFKNIFVSSECDGKVVKYNSSGIFEFEFSQPYNWGMAITSGNQIAVAARSQPYEIYTYDASGVPASTLSLTGNTEGSFYLDLEIDGEGSYYLLDPQNGKIDKFGADGVFINSFDLVAQGYQPYNGWDFTLDAAGNLYVQLFPYNNDPKVLKFGPGFNFISSFGQNHVINPIGIVATSLAGIYVGDEYAGLLLFSESGNFIKNVTPLKNAEGQFNSPNDIAIDSKGNRFIVDQFNARVQKFDSQGNFLAAFGTRGSADGQFQFPVAIAIDQSDNIYVADNANNRIQKFSPALTHLLSFGGSGSGNGQFNNPSDIAITDRGEVLIVDAGNYRIQKFNASGIFQSTFGSAGVADGEFQSISAMSVDKGGDIFVFDYDARLQRFSSDGVFKNKLSLLGALSNYPNDMSIDRAGNIYVSHGNGNIKKFDSNGGLLANIAISSTTSSADGEIAFGSAVETNASGDTVWVADSKLNRISIFTMNDRQLNSSDSLALVDLYNATNGPAWTESANWLTAPVKTWHGVAITGGKVRSINLHANDLEGILPASFSSLDELAQIDFSNNALTGEFDVNFFSGQPLLENLNLADNAITGSVPLLPAGIRNVDLSNNTFTSLIELPSSVVSMDASFNNLDTLGDFSTTALQKLHVQENNLTFGDLEPNISISDFMYSPQDSVGLKESVLKNLNATDSIVSKIDGTANTYEWYKNGQLIIDEATRKLVFANITVDDDAIYYYKATNSLLPALTLTSRPVEFKVSSLRRDSIALHQFYLETAGDNWLNNENWISTPLSENNWFGVTVTNNRVTSISLPGNNLDGKVSDILSDVAELQLIDVSDNKIASFPDVSNLTGLTTLNVSGNNLDFASLEPNIGVPDFQYQNQANIGSGSTVLLPAGDPYSIDLAVGGENNNYQWKRNDVIVENETSDIFSIGAITRDNMGRYVCEITNDLVTGLTLTTTADTIYAVANISGMVMSAIDVPATGGNVKLLRVQSTGGYDTTRIEPINEDGTFDLENIILDDYSLVTFIDTIIYDGALPTYYKNTIFWEEADTIFLNASVDSIDIVTQYKPLTMPEGNGEISGYLIEDDGLGGGRTKANKRVSGAGVTARRVERTGRGKEETLTLVAHQFTNAEGEFRFTKLLEGDYRLNIQYPGYPMDETSYITVAVGSGLESQKRVEAAVEEGKIVVRQLVITDVWDLEDYHVDVFPNPTSSYINLEFLNESNSRTVYLYDLNGREVLNEIAFGKTVRINLNGLGVGNYILNVKDHNDIVKSVQIVIE